MEKRKRVNVWFDRPGDFLDVCWGSGEWAVRSHTPPDNELGIEIHLTDNYQATGFFIFGANHYSNKCDSKTTVVAAVQPHPVTVKYDRLTDQWDVQWGPGAVQCADTPNPRIKARVDASGDIQGVLITDLRTFEDEILNQDIYPVKPGAAAAQGESP